MILFDGVSFCYNANEETSFNLMEVSFSLKKGIINGLIGSNGCGKSTIARLIVDLLEPTSGKISFENEKSDNSPYYFSGMIFQPRAWKKIRCYLRYLTRRKLRTYSTRR